MRTLKTSNAIKNRLQKLSLKIGRTKSYDEQEDLLKLRRNLEDSYLALLRIETPTRRWILEKLEQEMDLANCAV